MALYPDVAPFADNRFDCRDLLQRNVIYHGTGRASGISSWYTSQIVRLQKIGLKRRTSAFGCSRTDSKARVKLEALGNVPATGQSRSAGAPAGELITALRAHRPRLVFLSACVGWSR